MALSDNPQPSKESVATPTSGTSRLNVEACAEAIRVAVHSLASTDADFPLTLRLTDYRACLDANGHRVMGIGSSDAALELLCRVPHIAASWVRVLILTSLESLGIPNPTAEIDQETEALICRIAEDIIISAAGAQELQQVMGCVHGGLMRSGDWWAMYLKVSQLALEKTESDWRFSLDP